ncbi:MAG: ATP-binding protein, partial [Candidatus Saccharibacteria bacterium]
MLNGYIYTSVLFAFLFVILGLLVFLRNTKQLINRQFLLFGIFAAGWLLSNYLGGAPTVTHKFALVANRLVLGFAAAMAIALLSFVLRLTSTRVKFIKSLLAVNVVTILLCGTNLIVDNVSLQPNTYSIQFGVLAIPYFAILLTDFIIVIIVLIRSLRRSRGILRDQISTILLSIAITFGGVMITNALLPVAFNYYGLTNAGSLFSIVLVSGVAYTIVRHKLFDVRLVVARSLTYLLAVSVLGVGYSLLSLTIVSHFVQSNGRVLNIFVNTLLIVFAAVAFTPLKKFFDKATNRFFYKDAYDSQLFLDQFNKILVSTYDLNTLLKRSAEVIEATLKPDYTAFGIKGTPTTPQRIIGTIKHPDLTEKDIAQVNKMTPRTDRKVVVADLLDENHLDLQKILQGKGISIMARLAATSREDDAGYLILGSKKSGNPYSSQDVKIVQIIANELVIAVQNSLRIEEIQNFNLTLRAKVDEATRKLRRTNEKLKVLDETKDDFISMASHQLRTPLTSVKGYISMVLEEDAGKITPMQREMLGQAFFSSQRMVYLISDLLNVSRLKTGKFIIDAVKVDLVELVHQEMHQLEEAAASRSLTLTFDAPKDFPTLMFDETKTRQIIMNFVDNAIYYTPAGGHVVVRLVNNPSTVELRVEDDGIGVPKAEQHHLFTKFYRAGNARQARPDGTGLGLFMAKKVIAAQGGSTLF